jgi:hypothetical protein
MALDLFADGLDRGVGAQEAIGQGFVFAQKSEKQVFCLDVWRTELAGFVARKEDDAPRFFSISFKHD